MIPFLFAGGMVTKAVMIGLIAIMLGTGVSCSYKMGELALAKNKIGKLEVKNGELTADNTTLKSNNAILKGNLSAAEEANKTTIEANRQLLKERQDAQTAIDNLAKDKKKALDNLAVANKKIDDMLKDPKNNGSVAPVLRETIRDIQGRSK